MFKTFHDMLKNDERIQFTVTRKGDQLAVLVQPVLQGAADDKASETILSLRGALSMPLYVITHPENLDRDFPQSLADFAGFREQGHGDLNEVMSRIKEAGIGAPLRDRASDRAHAGVALAADKRAAAARGRSRSRAQASGRRARQPRLHQRPWSARAAARARGLRAGRASWRPCATWRRPRPAATSMDRSPRSPASASRSARSSTRFHEPPGSRAARCRRPTPVGAVHR